MSHAKHSMGLALLAVATAATLAAAPAWSQDAGAPRAAAVKLDRLDSKLLQDLAEGSVAEIAAANVALEKSKNPDIRAYAERMLESHGAMLDDAKKLAAIKNVKLPTEPGFVHRTKIATSKALSEKLRDKEYVKQAGIQGHEDLLKHIRKIGKESQDADIKALALKLAPAAEENLKAAKAIPLEH